MFLFCYFLDDVKPMDEEDFEEELKLMKILKGHKNVVRLLGACTCT